MFEILEQYHPIHELNSLNIEGFKTVTSNKHTRTHSNSSVDSNPLIPTQNVFQNLEQDKMDESEYLRSTSQKRLISNLLGWN